MKRHLKQEQILDYLFGLCDPSDAKRAKDHLADCPDCRRLAKMLRARFGTLEALRDTEPASERLIAETLRRVSTTRPEPRVLRFPAYAFWSAATVAAVLLAVVLVAPKVGRSPHMELAKAAPPAPPAAAPASLGGGSPVEEAPAESVEVAAVMVPPEPPPEERMEAEGVLLAEAPADKDAAYREAEQILADAAGAPAGPALAVARGFSGAALSEHAPSTPVAPKAVAPARERHAGRRVAKPRPEAAKMSHLPKGWSFEPTNDVRVLFIPLKSKADGLRPPATAGLVERYWQIRVVNEAATAQTVRVRRRFDQPGASIQLLNEEGRLARQTAEEVVIETEVPGGAFRAIQCLILEPAITMKESAP